MTWRAGKWVRRALSRHAGVRRTDGWTDDKKGMLRGGVDGRGVERKDYIRAEAVVGHQNKCNESCKIKEVKF